MINSMCDHFRIAISLRFISISYYSQQNVLAACVYVYKMRSELARLQTVSATAMIHRPANGEYTELNCKLTESTSLFNSQYFFSLSPMLFCYCWVRGYCYKFEIRWLNLYFVENIPSNACFIVCSSASSLLSTEITHVLFLLRSRVSESPRVWVCVPASVRFHCGCMQCRCDNTLNVRWYTVCTFTRLHRTVFAIIISIQ